MNEYQTKVSSCIERVKNEIKAQGLHYQSIADRLNISLLTVKRQLNGEDISLTKLLVLCDVAGLNFSEIWQSVDETSISHSIFTDAQDQAFYANPHLMSFFFELFQKDKTPEQIQQHWNLTPASLHLYLRKLESLNLIQTTEQKKIRFTVSEPVGFGPESKVINQEVSKALAEASRQFIGNNEQQEFLLAKPMKLSQELRHKMYQDLVDVISQYAELSERYFIQSDYPIFNLITYDYQATSKAQSDDIINVKKFN